PGAPPRKLEVEAINSTAIRVTWKPPLSVKQHGQIRGYQVIYSRLENGEPRGHPNIMDVALPEAQPEETSVCRGGGGGKTLILKRDLDFHEYFKSEDQTLGL
ncbi:receptor-type tyrosine-protein phosphatase F isoform X1, partial [Tachysurus ichikawai]